MLSDKGLFMPSTRTRYTLAELVKHPHLKNARQQMRDELKEEKFSTAVRVTSTCQGGESILGRKKRFRGPAERMINVATLVTLDVGFQEIEKLSDGGV